MAFNERRDLAAQDVALARTASVQRAEDPVGEVVDMYEIQSEVFECAIPEPPVRQRAKVRTDSGVVVRTVHLTRLDDHDRRTALRRIERDLVRAPLRVLVRGRRRRRWTMPLCHDFAVGVS